MRFWGRLKIKKYKVYIEEHVVECIEIEHSTDIQNSLLKYNDLQDFHTKMFIVADKIRKQEFEKKMNYLAFKKLKVNNRVEFLSYDRLVELYEITKKNLQEITL